MFCFYQAANLRFSLQLKEAWLFYFWFLLDCETKLEENNNPEEPKRQPRARIHLSTGKKLISRSGFLIDLRINIKVILR